MRRDCTYDEIDKAALKNAEEQLRQQSTLDSLVGLLPCPFCGAMPDIRDGGDWHFTHARDCFIEDHDWIVGERRKKAWNTRQPNASHEAERRSDSV